MLKEEHFTEAGIQFELAANFYKKAHEYHLIGEYEKSALEVQKAVAHHKKAEFHNSQVVKLNTIINSTSRELKANLTGN